MLGLKKKHNVYGIFSTSKLARSINSFTKYEYKNFSQYSDIEKDFVEAKDKEILKGFDLLVSEGLYCEASSAAIIGSLKKIKQKNLCCIITGGTQKNLVTFQSSF